MPKVSMRDMLQAGVHFGHQTRFWNPKMGRYIFGERNKIHIINLEKTLPAFNDALNFVSKLAAKKSKILFIGTKRAASKIVAEQAKRCGMPYVDHRWLGGMLTNYKTIRQSIRRLRDLEAQFQDGVFDRLTKKEAMMNVRNLEKLERSFGGIKEMGGLPDAIFIIDVDHEKIAIQEAGKLGITVIGVVDTNSSPNGVDYVIPGNDDALRAIQLYITAAADAILEGSASVATGGKDAVLAMENMAVKENLDVTIERGSVDTVPHASDKISNAVTEPLNKSEPALQEPALQDKVMFGDEAAVAPNRSELIEKVPSDEYSEIKENVEIKSAPGEVAALNEEKNVPLVMKESGEKFDALKKEAKTITTNVESKTTKENVDVKISDQSTQEKATLKKAKISSSAIQTEKSTVKTKSVKSKENVLDDGNTASQAKVKPKIKTHVTVNATDEEKKDIASTTKTKKETPSSSSNKPKVKASVRKKAEPSALKKKSDAKIDVSDKAAKVPSKDNKDASS